MTCKICNKGHRTQDHDNFEFLNNITITDKKWITKILKEVGLVRNSGYWLYSPVGKCGDLVIKAMKKSFNYALDVQHEKGGGE